MKNILNKSLLLLATTTIVSCSTQKKATPTDPNLLSQTQQTNTSELIVSEASVQQFISGGAKEDLPYYEAKIMFANIPANMNITSCFYGKYQGLIGATNFNGNKLSVTLRASEKASIKKGTKLYVTYKKNEMENIFVVEPFTVKEPVRMP